MDSESNDDVLREAEERQLNYSDSEAVFHHMPRLQTFEEMIQSDAYIKKEIRKMFAEYGISKVHTMFHQVLQEDFEALQAILILSVKEEVKIKKEVKVKQEKVKEFIPVVPEVVVAKPLKKEKEKPKKVKKVEEKKVEIMEDDFIDGLVAAPHRITNNTQVVVTKLKEGEEDNVPPNLTTKELREWQKEQEDKKKAELIGQGIDPASLLTVENLKTWVEDEKKSYSYIARRLVGLPEAQVSAEAKKHNIVSEIAKRRLAVIAARKGGK